MAKKSKKLRIGDMGFSGGLYTSRQPTYLVHQSQFTILFGKLFDHIHETPKLSIARSIRSVAWPILTGTFSLLIVKSEFNGMLWIDGPTVHGIIKTAFVCSIIGVIISECYIRSTEKKLGYPITRDAAIGWAENEASKMLKTEVETSPVQSGSVDVPVQDD